MIARLAALGMASTLALAGAAHAASPQQAAVDTYLAITGISADPDGSIGTSTDIGTTTSAPESRPAYGELAPLDGRVVALGSGTAVVYYTYDEDGADLVRVVTTLGTETDGAAAPAASARFVSYLAPGQTAEVSLAGLGDAAEPSASLELAYDGGLLTVRPVTAAQPEG